MKKLLMILFLSFLSSIAMAKGNNAETFTVTSVEIGDYCWVQGTLSNGFVTKKASFLLNVDSSKKICQSGTSEEETKLWQGKKWKIKTKSMDICEHLPPCDQGDKMKKVKGIYDFTEIK